MILALDECVVAYKASLTRYNCNIEFVVNNYTGIRYSKILKIGSQWGHVYTLFNYAETGNNSSSPSPTRCLQLPAILLKIDELGTDLSMLSLKYVLYILGPLL